MAFHLEVAAPIPRIRPNPGRSFAARRSDTLRATFEVSRRCTARLSSACRMNSLPLLAHERIVKGVEMRLAGDITLQDGGGHARGEMRVRWFDAAAG